MKRTGTFAFDGTHTEFMFRTGWSATTIYYSELKFNKSQINAMTNKKVTVGAIKDDSHAFNVACTFDFTNNTVTLSGTLDILSVEIFSR